MFIWRFSLLLAGATIVLFAASVLSHQVGELELEAHPQFRACCNAASDEYEGDCHKATIQWVEERGMYYIIVINGNVTAIQKKKFHPLPTRHTWGCRVDVNLPYTDKNTRCIIYPQGRAVG